MGHPYLYDKIDDLFISFQHNINMILTRYLYDKSKVEPSLIHAISQTDYHQAVFWAYELYFSGHEEEVLDLLHRIYLEVFHENHPRLGAYFEKKSRELKDRPELVAVYVKNLTMKNWEIRETPGGKFVNVKPHHIEPFRTKEPEGPGWQFLRKVCLYGVLGNCSQDDLRIYREEWMNHGSPIWQTRKMDERYDFEPDEQPLEIQTYCMGKICE